MTWWPSRTGGAACAGPGEPDRSLSSALQTEGGDMTASDLTHSPLRELASRVAGGVETTSSWNKDTGALTVWVRDRASGGHL